MVSDSTLMQTVKCHKNSFILEPEGDQQEQQPEEEFVGIPKYIGSGSHHFSDIRYRFLIMPRYKNDLHSITRSGRLSQKHFLIVASQIIDVLMHLHSKQYVHSDIKAENIMIGQCRGQNRFPFDSGRKGNGSKQLPIEFGGANPLRSCRVKNSSRGQALYNDMVRSHYLRPSRSVTYSIDENSRSSHALETDHDSSDDSEEDEDFQLSPKKRKARQALKKAKAKKNGFKRHDKSAALRATTSLFTMPADPPSFESDSDDRVFVIDYGLATKFIDTNGEHKPFCMDQRRAHDGTLEFTSRDAHFGAHSRRSDLECLGYNLIYWSQGFLPWKDDKLKEQPELVHRLKEVFMTDVKEMLKLLYGKDVPRYLGEFMQYVGQLEFDEEPDYAFLKGLFETEFDRLSFKTSDMKLTLSEMRNQCEPNDKTLSENDLMMSVITDTKTARKLGFLIVTDSFDGAELPLKPNESISLNVSCKASPKNLRSKEKTKGKRPKRQPKPTERELISEKMAQGKKLSIAEIATLDPDQIGRDRADREYEKIDEKLQTPQRYTGNPTYAILEIENKLRSKQNGSNAMATNGEVEAVRGFKPMVNIFKKQQQIVIEHQITPISHLPPKKRGDGLRNVIKPTAKNLTYKIEISKKTRRAGRKNCTAKVQEVEEAAVEEEETEDIVQEEPVEVPEPPRRKRGRPAKKRRKATVVQPEPVVLMQEQVAEEESAEETAAIVPPVVKRKRGRPRIIRNVIEPPETEEDSVYYDIPGEGSNDGVKEMSEDENEPDIIPQPKRVRRNTPTDENSNQGSVASTSMGGKIRNQYYADDDYDASTDETTNMSSVSNVTKTSVSSIKPPRRGRQTTSRDSDGIATRNKVKSRSTSRSAAAFTEVTEATDQSEYSEAFDNDSEFQLQSGDESAEEIDEPEQAMEFDQSETEEDEATDESEMADSNDSNDSIDIKYSPIKTRHARRRVHHFNIKQIRGELKFKCLTAWLIELEMSSQQVVASMRCMTTPETFDWYQRKDNSSKHKLSQHVTCNVNIIFR